MNGIAGPLISLQLIWMPVLGGRLYLDELYCLSQARVHTRGRIGEASQAPTSSLWASVYRRCHMTSWVHPGLSFQAVWPWRVTSPFRVCFLTKNEDNGTILQSCLGNCVCNAWKWLDYSHSIISVSFPLKIQHKDTCQVKVIILSLPWHQQRRKERRKSRVGCALPEYNWGSQVVQ